MVSTKLQMIFTKDEISRLSIKETPGTKPQIIVDVHGMKCSQARRFINNIINTIRESFKLIIIHGYNHGTAIKDMLADNFCNSHIAEQYIDPYNQGVTHMLIA